MLDTSEANNLDIHMQKTTEYGAMAILSVSSYGNPNKITSGETTTGNSTGVVMPLKYEWTQGGDTTWYDSRYRNYYDRNNETSRLGDALLETKGWHNSAYGWLNSYSTLIRGGSNGIFSYTEGNSSDPGYWSTGEYPSRAVVVVGEGI